MIILHLPEKPTPQQRYRFRRLNKFIVTYDPQSRDKKLLQKEFLKQYNKPPLIGLLSVIFEFTFSPPKSTSKKKRKLLLDDKYKISKPDTSNCIKYYEDVMNGIIYKDDAQIACLQASKCWGDKNSVLIMINTLNY